MQNISWHVLEFEEKDRHPDWVWYAGLIFAVAATLAFFYGNIFFGIFLIIAGIMVIIFAGRKPQMLTITLGEKAVQVNEESIDYARVREFWIDETEKQDKLLLLVRGSFVPIMAFTLQGVTAEAVREFLKEKGCIEKPIRESLGIKIAERLGF